jgi:hypothetical protein
VRRLPVAETAARTVFVVAALLALRLAVRERPTAHADSAEYLLTAESLFNHGTPNVHPADLLTFGRTASCFPLEGDHGRPLGLGLIWADLTYGIRSDMSRHMRTTVRLDDALLERAKREAERRGETLTSLIERGLRLVLARPERRPERQHVELPVCREGGGTLPGVDLDDSAALLDIVEGRR